MPPVTPGFVTVTAAVPADAVSVSGTVAVNWVALTKVVINAVPFQLMVALLLKWVPVAMRPFVPSELPAAALAGTRAAMVGIVPGDGGVFMPDFALYPHPRPATRSVTRTNVFAVFIISPNGPMGSDEEKSRRMADPGCQNAVIFMSMFCQSNLWP
jgi:hypothetical protein